VPGNPVVTGTVISSTAFNATIQDIAAGLSNAVTRDGQSPATGNLPMGGNKITGLAAPTAAGDALAFGSDATVANLSMTGSARRITGDFSNATVSSRVFFQTASAASNSFVQVAPTSDLLASGFVATNVTPLGVGASLDLIAGANGSTECAIRSSSYQGGAVLPMTFYVGGTQRLRVDTSGNVAVNSSTGSLGYGSGAGGTVIQATSKSTAVTLNRPTGKITVNGSTLGANAVVEFTLNNTRITANDVICVSLAAPIANMSSYLVTTFAQSGGAVIGIRNISAGSLSEAFTINFAVIKGATS